MAPTTNLGAFKGGSLPNVSEQNRKQQYQEVQQLEQELIDSSKEITDAIDSASEKV